MQVNIDRIFSRFRRHGYQLREWVSGKVQVKQPNGKYKVFDNYQEAYNYYFD